MVPSHPQNRLLVVRYDAIGDYVLFRSVLRVLRSSERFRDMHVTLLGNRIWRDLFETFDADLADDRLWINRFDYVKRGLDNLLPCVWRFRPALRRNRARLRQQLLERHFDCVLFPAVHRDTQYDELLAGVAPEMLGVATQQALPTDSLFTELAPASEASFTFTKNVQALEFFTREPSTLTRPAPLVPLSVNGDTPTTAVLFPGASHWTRRWPVTRYAGVARHLIDAHGLDVVVVGGREDGRRGHELVRLTGRADRIRSEVGCGTLADMARAIAGARLVVSNDSCAAHLAAVQEVPTLCITNGISGRGLFWPYPKELGLPFTTLVATPHGSHNSGLVSTQTRSWLNLTALRVEDVCSAVDSALSMGNRHVQ